MKRTLLLLVLLLLAGVCACARKKALPAPAAKAEAAVAPRPPLSHTMSGPRQPGVISRLAPIAETEASGLLPVPAGARELHAVAHAQIGERIEGSWCYDAGTLADLGAALARQYAAAGWQDFTVHPNPNLPDRATVTARKPPYALYGSIQRATLAGCRGVDGKTYVSLGVHHVEAVAPPPAPLGARGTTGLRGP